MGLRLSLKTNGVTVRQYEDKLHFTDKMRIKMGQYVVKYFQGERERNGELV